MREVLKILALSASLFATSCLPAMADGETATQLPFVGCKSDGQLGPQAAPPDTGKAPSIRASVAPFLAYYAAASDNGVVAPRGWYCFGYYGSNGAYLLLSPSPATGKDSLLDPSVHFISGPGIQISESISDTSGRFEVAKIAARLFPAYRQFVENVVAEHLEPASDFPFGPYPDDIITRHDDNDVSFETPPDKNGMGTNSWFVKNNLPITGEAIMTEDELTVLDIRLPSKLRFLAPVIFEANRQAILSSGNQ